MGPKGNVLALTVLLSRPLPRGAYSLITWPDADTVAIEPVAPKTPPLVFRLPKAASRPAPAPAAGAGGSPEGKR